ncbi:MAG: hypothetical protein JWO60_2886 [Frankiales bacterium]|nr:hypothetical protein [Frankiales bacterium]
MTREEFWALVQQTLRDAQSLPDPRRGLLRRRVALRPGERHVEALLRRLATLPDDALLAFQSHLDALRGEAARADVRGAARIACGGAMGEDAFTDFRTWLVSQGRAAHARVLQDPDALVDVAPPDLVERVGDAELWGYVALEVWDSRHDDDMPRPAFDSGPEHQEQDEVDPQRYPRLTARYG